MCLQGFVFSFSLFELFSLIFLLFIFYVVVDVVRTDSHLEFYEDTRNLARMSDILAVYAWVDPATGYCQGCGLPISVVFWLESIAISRVPNF